MKDYFVASSLKLINSKYNYNQDMIDRVKYGLEIIYITITKISVILIVSYLFNLLKETLIFCLLINGLRMFSFGLHAKKSWHCYVSSAFSFILMPYIFININITILQRIIICSLGLLSMILFAPADTKKRPIVNKQLRSKLKIKSCIVTIFYSIICLLIKNWMISNLIVLSIITQAFIINPIIYKLFGLSYNNYKNYE